MFSLKKDIEVQEQIVFLNKITYTRFTRKEKLGKNDLVEHLSPKLRTHFVVFYNLYI